MLVLTEEKIGYASIDTDVQSPHQWGVGEHVDVSIPPFKMLAPDTESYI